MKTVKILGLLALFLTMAMAPSIAVAQYPDCTGQGDNLVGLVWSNGEFSIDGPPNQPQTATLYLFNVTGVAVNAFELDLDYPENGLFTLDAILPPGAINVGQQHGEFIVGLAEDIFPDENGAIPLIEFQFLPIVDTQMDFFAGMTSAPSIPGNMAFQVDGALVPMYAVGGPGEPIGNLNGPPLDYCTGGGNLPPAVDDIPSQTIAEGENFTSINLDDFVNDPDNEDFELTWTVTGTIDLIVDISANRAAIITVPDAEWNGSETLIFRATDPDGRFDTDIAVFTVTGINDPPAVGDIPGQTINEGQIFSTINLDDFVFDPDNLPADMTWTAEGQIELTVDIDVNRVATITAPDLDWNGSELITFVATDPGQLSSGQGAGFTVLAVNDAPVLAEIGGQTINELTELTFTASATDVDLPPQNLTFSLDAAAIAAGMILDPNTGVFTWMPGEAQGPGTYTVTVTVSDGVLTDQETLLIDVGEVNVAPVLGPIDNQTVAELTELTFTVTANDTDLPAQNLTFSLDQASVDLGIVIDPNTGVVTWTPPEALGPALYPVEIFVTDGALIDDAAIDIEVTEVNVAPILSPIGIQTGPELEELTFVAVAIDFDLPAQGLTYTLDAAAVSAGMVIDPNSGVFTWVPDEFQGPGNFLATITVTDGDLTDQEIIDINVTEANVAPILVAIGDQAVAELAELAFTATANDTDFPAQDLFYSLDSAAIDAGMSIHPVTGVFTWTPNEVQGPGSFPVTVTVTDDGLTDEETLNIVVSEVNIAPVLDDIGDQAVAELAQLTFTAAALDLDLPLQGLTYSLDAAAVTAGMVIDPNTGLFTWMPTEVQGPGSYAATITVTDGALADAETINIDVTEVNVAPVLAAIGDQAVAELTELIFTATAIDTDLPAQALAFSLDASALDAGMVINPDTGVFTWTPTEAQGPGTFPATITVTDGILTDEETISIAVLDGNNAPVLAAVGDWFIEELEELSFTATATDVDLPPQDLSFSLDAASISAGMAIDSQTGGFTWIPTEAQGPGVFPATITVDDGLLTDQETFNITVVEVNAAPVVAGIPDQTISVGQAFALINLDDFVVDPDHADDQLTWAANGFEVLSVSIVDRIAMITAPAPAPGWTGSETVTFTAMDPGQLSGSDAATFTITAGSGDADGDGVPDDIDQCPEEDASFFDRDGDGCIDPVIGGRHIEYWGEGSFPLEYWIHQDGAPGISDNSDFVAIQEGFSLWTEDPETEVTVAYMGETSNPIADAFDGVHTVTFSDGEYPFPSGVIAVGLSTSYTEPDYDLGIRPGQIIDTDMIFNPLMTFRTDTSGPPDGTYIKGVVVHEAGHMLGLSHSGVQSSTMFYVLPPDDMAATLETEDRQAMFKAYHESGAHIGSGELSGTVTDGLTGEPVSGAIVFVMDEATGDTVASDFSLPMDGSFHFIGLTDGLYRLAIHPLNGSSTIGYLQPGNINSLINGTADVLFVPEFYDAAESNSDDPEAVSPVFVSSAGATVANFITNVDLTGPTIIAVSPEAGAIDVPIDTAILFRCDEAIDGGSLSGNFNFAAADGGDFLQGVASLVEDGRTLAYVPSVNLEFDTTYLLEVGAGITDLFGNPMGTDFSMTFTSESQPPVAISNLVPRKGVAGSLLVINGAGFSGETTENEVTFGGEEWTVEEASPSQIVVRVPEDVDTGTANIRVVNNDLGQPSNELSYTVLPPGGEAHGLETAVVDLFALPRQVEVAPDGDFVYVATDQGLSHVDVTDPTAPVANSLILGNGLSGLDVTPDGSRIYAISYGDGLLYRIGTDPVAELESISLDFRPEGILVDPSGQRAYLATDEGEIQVRDIVEGSVNFMDQVGALYTPGSSLLGPMALDPAGNFLLALDGAGQVLVFDLETFELHAQVDVLSSARDVVVGPRGERAYVTDDTGHVTIVSLTSFSSVLDIPTGGALLGAAVDPMGSFLYAVNHQLDNLDIVDLRSGSPTYRTITARVTQQINPVDVVLSPGGLYAYVLIESTRRLAINSVGVGPVLGSLSRRSGPEGTRVVLAGKGFDGGSVSFNGVPAVIERADDASITVAVPVGAATGPVMVLGDDSGELSNAIMFEVLTTSPAGGLHLTAEGQPDGLPTLTGALGADPNDKVVAVGSADGDVHLLDVDPNSLDFNQFIGRVDVLDDSVDDLATAPDGLTAYAVSGSQPYIYLFNINPASASFGSVLAKLKLDPDAIPQYLAVSPDGQLVLAADRSRNRYHIVDVAAERVLYSGPLGSAPGNGRMAFHPDGLFAYAVGTSEVVALDLDPASPGFGNVLSSVDVGQTANDLAFSPDGTQCYILTGPTSGSGDRALVTLNTVDPAAPANLGEISIPSTMTAGEENLAVSPAGDRALLYIRGDGLYLVDLPGGEILANPGIVAGGAKVDFGFSTDGLRVFAAAAEDGSVSTFDFNNLQRVDVVWGQGQTGEVNQMLDSSLRVRITDSESGTGLVGVPVTFAVDMAGKGLGAGLVAPYLMADYSDLPGTKDSRHVGLNKGLPDGNKDGGETDADAVVIPGLPYSDTGNTSDNLDDFDETCPYAAPGSPDVVYSWTADFTGAVTIDLCGSGFDTKLYVYENAPDPGNPWACNDDAYLAGDPCGERVSRIDEMAVLEGTTYLIVVDGFGGDAGDFSLSVVKDFESDPWGYFVTDNPEDRPTTLVVGTDDFGFANVSWNLGMAPGDQIVDVVALGAAGSPTQFTATAEFAGAILPFAAVETRFTPANSSTDVSVTTAVQIAFNRAVDPAGLTETTYFLSADGGATAVPSVIGLAGGNTTASLTPVEVLQYATVYTVVIGSGIQSETLEVLTNPQTFTFTTEAAPLAPSLTGISPPSAAELATVTISGSGFSSTLGQNVVFFGGTEAIITSAEPDFILTRVPLEVGSGEAPVQVLVNGVSTNSLPFVVLEPSHDGGDEVVVRVGTGTPTRTATVSPDGATIYAVSPEADLIIPIDLVTFTTLPSIPVGDMPWAITGHPDGKLAYVANRMSGDVSVIDIDPASPDYNQTIGSIEVGDQPVDIIVTPAGDRVLVANEESQDLSVIDSDSESESFNFVVNRVPVGSSLKTVTVSPDGARIYVGTDDGYAAIDSGDWVVRRVGTGSGVKTVTVSPDGALLVLVDTGGGVTVFDIAPGSPTEDQVVARVPVGGSVKTATVSPDGARLYAVMEEGDIINVFALEVEGSVGVVEEPGTPPVFELALLESLTAGENPQAVIFDPSGSGQFIVPNAGDNTITVFNDGAPVETGWLTGTVRADCPDPGTPLFGVPIDVFSATTGVLAASLVTDENGYYEVEVETGPYNVTLVTPLSYTIDEEVLSIVVSAAEPLEIDWDLTCQDIVPSQRRMSYWRHQVAAAVNGNAAEIDGPTLCGYLDQIESHFNNHRLNQVVVYEPPESGECEDKLLVANHLFRLGWDQYWPDRTQQELMALLLNVSSGKLSLAEIISHDGIQVSLAITYVNQLMTDGDPDNDRKAMRIANFINRGEMVNLGEIPDGLPEFAYRIVPKVFKLDEVYPNPFNPQTTIKFGVANAGRVRLKIFNIAGRLVHTLVDEHMKAGSYTKVWNGTDNGGRSAASGVYFLRMEAGTFVQTKKMTLMK